MWVYNGRTGAFTKLATDANDPRISPDGGSTDRRRGVADGRNADISGPAFTRSVSACAWGGATGPCVASLSACARCARPLAGRAPLPGTGSPRKAGPLAVRTVRAEG